MIVPAYRDLPDGDARGVFGDDDVLGTLNRQTPEAVAAAAASVRSGKVFSLNAPMELPDPPLFDREPFAHHVYQTRMGNRDDWVDNFYPQSSSQWDGFLHIAEPEIGSYNHQPPQALGIEHWARRGIAGRGILLDVERHLAARGETLHWHTERPITVEELEATRVAQGVEWREGDVLALRTGWWTGYLTASAEERHDVRSRHDSPGLEASREMAAYLWDHGISAAVADNVSVESMPLGPQLLHHLTLCRLGMPWGEMWWLDALAEDCAAEARWDFLLVSAPWNLTGGVGSPANALALR